MLKTIRRAGRVSLTTRAAERITPMRFASAGRHMCEAQRIDLKAAREGRMTWRAYFEKWELG